MSGLSEGDPPRSWEDVHHDIGVALDAVLHAVDCNAHPRLVQQTTVVFEELNRLRDIAAGEMVRPSVELRNEIERMADQYDDSE